jgi:hypothetical protein
MTIKVQLQREREAQAVSHKRLGVKELLLCLKLVEDQL